MQIRNRLASSIARKDLGRSHGDAIMAEMEVVSKLGGDYGWDKINAIHIRME